MQTPLPFTQLAPGAGIGVPAPIGWQSIAQRPLLVLVGVTGVGKSTTLEALAAMGLVFQLLPDRRELTDRVIIASAQTHAAQPVSPVKDRKLRFELTRAYRDLFPGGMAHALAQLWIEPYTLPGLVLFDGLRGANEVTHAAELLPAARFAVLDAPDAVRVARLMGRNDPFDQVDGAPIENPKLGVLQSFAGIGTPEAQRLFSDREEQALLEFVRTAAATPDALRTSLAIVVEERRNYDPAATRAALQQAAAARTRVIDTTRNTPEAVAAEILMLVEPCL